MLSAKKISYYCQAIAVVSPVSDFVAGLATH